MFENTPGVSPTPPSNLPTEPDDMFSAVEPAAPAGVASTAGLERSREGQVERPDPPNALEAGMLKRKETPVTTMPQVPAEEELPAPENAPVDMTKGPIIGKLVIGIVVLVVLIGGGVVAFMLYQRNANQSIAVNTTSFPAPQSGVAPASEVVSVPATPPTAPVVNDTPATPLETPATTPVTTTDAASKITNDQILFGEQLDSDKDSLSDSDEITLYRTDPRNIDTDGDGVSDGEEILVWKTNPLKPDTDGDGLTDGEEVKLWRTDPLNPDSDGDSHVDGQEVYNGYNPSGAGKLTRYPDGMSTSTYNAKYRKQ